MLWKVSTLKAGCSGLHSGNKQQGNLLGCLRVKGDKKPAFLFKASQPSANSLGSGLEFKGNTLVFALTP